MIEAVAGISLITPDRLANLVAAVERTTHLPGDMAELGVYRGGSAKVIASVCPAKRLHLFDTFTGLPHDEEPARDPEGHLHRGDYAGPYYQAAKFLYGCNVDFHPGLFPATTRGLERLRFSFVHIDCDLYQSAKDAIAWFWPRLEPGGILYFDDYGCRFTGVTEAVDNTFLPEMIERQYDYLGNQIGALVVKP